MTRWHGTIMLTGFLPFARPTARDAPGDPISADAIAGAGWLPDGAVRFMGLVDHSNVVQGRSDPRQGQGSDGAVHHPVLHGGHGFKACAMCVQRVSGI